MMLSEASKIEPLQFVSQCLHSLGISPNPIALEKLVRYTKLLLVHNQQVNLISRAYQEFNSVFIEHIYDSLLAFPIIEQHFQALLKETPGRKLQLLDIGSGGGLPGIPLACMNESIQIDLCESKLKKVTCLKEICEKLELKHVQVIHRNVREICGTYDMITARAFGTIAKIYKISKHLLERNEGSNIKKKPFSPKQGLLLLYKGREWVVQEELREFKDMFQYKGVRQSSHKQISYNIQTHKLTPSGAEVNFDKERILVEIVINPS